MFTIKAILVHFAPFSRDDETPHGDLGAITGVSLMLPICSNHAVELPKTTGPETESVPRSESDSLPRPHPAGLAFKIPSERLIPR